MPYIFPKRRLQPQDVLDPIELNEDLIPAADLYAGEINAHNVSATVQGNITQPAAATHSYVYKEKMSDPGLGDSSSGYTHPTPGTASGSLVASHKIANDMNWDLVSDMSFEKTTGSSKLWIVGHVTYIWLGFTTISDSWGHRFSSGTPTDVQRSPFHPAGVQFALRVDGHLIESTMTGKISSWQKVSMPAKAQDQRTSGSAHRKFPGPGIPTELETHTMGPHCASVRLGTFYEVMPGTHTIEIVARRFPPFGQATHEGTGSWAANEPNFVHVYNRKLFVLDMPENPPNSSADTAISVGTFDTEAVFDRPSIEAEKVDRLAAAFTNVQNGSLARGALNHYHLTSPVIAANQATITHSVSALESKYDGYNDQSVTTSTSGTGWYLLNNGGGEYLYTAGSPLNWETSDSSIFIILANVQVKSLRKHLTNYMDFFGSLVLGYKPAGGGSAVILGQSEVYINDYNHLARNDGPTYRHLDESYDVALFAVVKSTDITDSEVNYFGVYGATTGSTHTSGQSVMTFHRGSIQVIQLKA